MKPCPFCGGKVGMYVSDDPWRAIVIRCVNKECDASVVFHLADRDKSIVSWNRRVEE